jgi:hypothetical protein
VGEVFFSDPTRRRTHCGRRCLSAVTSKTRQRREPPPQIPRSDPPLRSPVGSKVDTLSNTSLMSNRDHSLQRELLQRSPTATGSRQCPPDPPHRGTGRSPLVQMSSALSGGSSMSNTPIAGAITPSDVSASSAAAATPGYMPPLDSVSASRAGTNLTKPRRTFPDGPPMPPRDFQLGDLGRHGPRRYEGAVAPAIESGGPEQPAP